MHTINRRRLTTAVVGIVGLLAVTAGPAVGDMHPPFVGPLGLALGDDGTAYVADAFTGELIAIAPDGTRSTIATSGEIAGVDAAGKGQVVYVETQFGPSGVADAGVSRVWPSGRTQFLFSTHQFEVLDNPDSGNSYGFLDTDASCLDELPEELAFLAQYDGIVESHPYAIAILPGGGYLVADAAANAIFQVAPNGRSASVVAVLPPVEQVVTADAAVNFGLPECLVGETFYGEPVPTDVEIGPDGHYYVTSLPGAPEAPGAGSVWRIDSGTWALSQVAAGLTMAVDLAVEADGTLLVAELFGPPNSPGLPGRVVEATPGGPVHVADVPLPGAIEIADDGTAYVTTYAVAVFFGLDPAGEVISLP